MKFHDYSFPFILYLIIIFVWGLTLTHICVPSKFLGIINQNLSVFQVQPWSFVVLINLRYIPWTPLNKQHLTWTKSWTLIGNSSNSIGSIVTTLNCLISVGSHSKSHVVVTFYQHHHFLPTKLYHTLQCAH